MSNASAIPSHSAWSLTTPAIPRFVWIASAVSIGLHASLLFFVSVEIARQSGLSSLVNDLHVQLVTKREAVGSAEAATPSLDLRKLQPIRNELRHYDPAPHLGIPVPMLRQPALFEDAQYIAASRLTVRPKALEEIRVPFPKGTDLDGVAKAMVTLFIDEDGKVARVRVDDSKLPLVFQESATTAFLRGRFAPGLLDDVPVRSYLRIEVFFESDSTGQAATQPAANSSALAKSGE